MRSVLRVMLAAGALAAATLAAAAADRTIVVLDGSGSMWGQIEGRPKLEIARETLRSVLATIPAEMELGLMAYGHRQKGVCTDIELVVPPAPGTGQAIAEAADSMRFLGMTPLSEAVQQAAEALRYTEEKATVILITDGIETCDADPCALGEALEQSGVDFTAHVVGFGLSDDEGRQVACLAQNTGGRYIQAADAGQLTEALTRTVIARAEPEPEPEPEAEPEPEPALEFNFAPTVALAETSPDLDDDSGHYIDVFRANPDGSRGEPLGRNYGNRKANLDPGDYVVEMGLGEAKLEQKVAVEAGRTAAPHFVLDAGSLTITPFAAEGGDVVDGAAVVIDYPGEGETTTYGRSTQVLPAGDQIVTVRIGQGEVTETIPLKAGETVEKDIVVGVGRAVVNAFYVEGMKVEEGGLATSVYGVRKKIDGSRDEFGYGYGPDSGYDLPPGDYAFRVRLDEAEAEAVATVRTGEMTEVSVILDAGVLAVTAPGSKILEIFKAKANIQGNRDQISYAYSESHNVTLPAGDYLLVVTKEDDSETKVEREISITGGERTEVTIE